MCFLEDYDIIEDDDLRYRHHKQNVNDVLYGFEYNEEKQIIDIHDVSIDYRKNHKFYCLHCGNEMVASLKDDYRRKHFRHKTTVECDYDHYLHTLSEYLFKKAYDSASTFFLSYQKYQECVNQSCKYRNLDCDRRTIRHDVNLKEWYPFCEIEKGIKGKDGNNYIADILLTSDRLDFPPLLIEIFVTHECTEQKKMSGLRIAELKINSEEDILNICQSWEIAGDKGVNLYNFNLIDKRQLESKILRYIYNEEIGSYTKMISCKEATIAQDDHSSLEMNIVRNNGLYSEKEVEQQINKRYKLEKNFEPSCDNCAHYYQYNKYDDKTTEHPYCYLPEGLCDKYKRRKSPNPLTDISPKDYIIEVIKGELPSDYKVLIYGPHNFHNRYVVESHFKRLLKNRIDEEIVVVTGPSSEKLAFNVLSVAQDLSIPYELKLEDWKNVGKSAAYKCIGELLNEASAVIAFHDGKDNLTSHLIEQTKKRNLPLRIVDLTKDKYICPKCFGELNLKNGSRGLFIACTNYPDCDYTHSYDENMWQEIIRRHK